MGECSTCVTSCLFFQCHRIYDNDVTNAAQITLTYVSPISTSSLPNLIS